MIFVYISMGVMVFAIVWNMFILPNVRFNKTFEELSKLEEYGFIAWPVKDKEYDFLLEGDELTFQVKIVAIPSNSTVTINNKWTWKLSWGGSKYNKGRAYPHNRYLHEVSGFLKQVTKKEKPTIKLVILYQDTERILMYLNESELDVITPDKTPHGYKVTTLKSIYKDFPSLLNIK